MQHSRWGSRVGRAAILVAVGVLVGSVMLTPVGAHIKNFNHLKTKHFYTKKAADARFVDTNEAPGIAAAAAAPLASRVAFAVNATADKSLDPGGTDLEVQQLSVSITAPAPGFLIIQGHLESEDLTNDDVWRCLVRLNGTTVPSSESQVQTNGTSNVNEREDCFSLATVPVNVGAHTVVLYADDVTFATTRTNRQYLSAMYVPFDGTGNRPTTFPIA